MIIKSHFHKKGFALRLVLKQRLEASRKWPVENKTSRGWSPANLSCLLLNMNVFFCFQPLTKNVQLADAGGWSLFVGFARSAPTSSTFLVSG